MAPAFPRRQAGFTLVEMLVALALFGIIAGVATALMAGSTRTYAMSEAALADISATENLRRILAADLGQAAARPSITADGKLLPAFVLMPEGLLLVRHGLTASLPAVEKVSWGLVDGKLLRQSFPAVDNSAPGRAIVMMQGVQAVRLRVADEEGWHDQWAAGQADQLPRAVELVVTPRSGKSIAMRFLVGAG